MAQFVGQALALNAEFLAIGVEIRIAERGIGAQPALDILGIGLPLYGIVRLPLAAWRDEAHSVRQADGPVEPRRFVVVDAKPDDRAVFDDGKGQGSVAPITGDAEQASFRPIGDLPLLM